MHYSSDVCLIHKCHLSQSSLRGLSHSHLRASHAGTSHLSGHTAGVSSAYAHGSPSGWLAGPPAQRSAGAEAELGKWAPQPGSSPGVNGSEDGEAGTDRSTNYSGNELLYELFWQALSGPQPAGYSLKYFAEVFLSLFHVDHTFQTSYTCCYPRSSLSFYLRPKTQMQHYHGCNTTTDASQVLGRPRQLLSISYSFKYFSGQGSFSTAA